MLFIIEVLSCSFERIIALSERLYHWHGATFQCTFLWYLTYITDSDLTGDSDEINLVMLPILLSLTVVATKLLPGIVFTSKSKTSLSRK